MDVGDPGNDDRAVEVPAASWLEASVMSTVMGKGQTLHGRGDGCCARTALPRSWMGSLLPLLPRTLGVRTCPFLESLLLSSCPRPPAAQAPRPPSPFPGGPVLRTGCQVGEADATKGAVAESGSIKFRSRAEGLEGPHSERGWASYVGWRRQEVKSRGSGGRGLGNSTAILQAAGGSQQVASPTPRTPLLELASPRPQCPAVP